MEKYFNNKNYTIYKTKTKIFSDNKKKKNQNIYFNLNPEYQNNNYNKTNQNFFQYNNNINNNYSQYDLNKNTQIPTYIPFNVINNNISSNDRIYQKYYYINERNTPLKNYASNNNHPFTTNDRNFLGERILENPNIQKEINLEENDYMNKTTGFKILKRTLSSYNNKYKLLGRYKTIQTDSKSGELSFRQNNKQYINIYRNKLVKVFVQNINKIMEKIKKREIIKMFYNNLKKYYYSKRRRINYINKELNQNDPKYTEYKDMIYNYIKSKNNLPMSKIYNILRPQDKMIFNTINKDKSKNKQKIDNDNNSSTIKVNKKEIERFKKMQKKYGNIYESKKKEIISFENKIKNYINHRTIESSSSTNNDNDISLKKFNVKTPNINAYKTKNIFKRKRRLNSKTSNKSYKTTSEVRNKYNIYIIKNIISSDKRLFLNINYINLENYNSSTKFYTNDILQISDLIDITLLGNKYNKNIIARHKKKLSKIEEEIDDKINSNLSMSIKDNNKFFEKKEEKEEENNNSIKSNIFNNKVYNSKKIGLSGIRRKYINYKTIKDNENKEN